MRASLKKLVSCTLALTLLVTCTVSGLALPVAAEGVSETNLLTNGDLEQGASVAWGNSAYVMDGVGKDGSKGIKIETTVNAGDAYKWPSADYKGAFNATLEPNTTYLFSFEYKHEGKGFGKFDVVRAGTDWTGWKDVENLTATEWTTVTIEFTTGAAANMNPQKGWEWAVRQVQWEHQIGTGATYFDNFKLVKKPAVAATGITLDKTETALAVGSSVMLTATLEPAGATGEAVVWTSSASTVATVDDTGLVMAISAGKATITATSGTLSASCTVTVLGKAESLRIAPNAVTMHPDYPTKLSALTTPENAATGGLTWSSSDDKIATVDQTGLVTAVAKSGTVTITVANDDGKSATATVTIGEYGNIFPNGNLEKGAADTFHHVPSEGVSIEDGVGIDGSKALKYSKDYTRAIIYFKKLNQVKMEPNSRYVLSFWSKGPSLRLHLTGGKATDITFADGKTTWNLNSSTDEWVETTIVFDTGANPSFDNNWAFELKQNAASVTADTYVDNITLTKQPNATSISIAATAELLPNDTKTLTVTSTPADTYRGTLTWSSSNPSAIAVTQDGVVTALKNEGTAIVTVSSSLGFTAACTVTINEYANLLKNGDFEQGDTNWKGELETYIRPGIGKDGGYGLALTVPEGVSTKNPGVFYKQALDVLPGTTYEVSFDYLATEGCSFRLWSGNMNLSSPSTEKGDGTVWKHASCTFTTPADMSLQTGWDLSIVCDAAGETPAVIDNVCLRLYNSGVTAESVTMSKSTLTLVPGRTESLALKATPTDGDTNRTTWKSSDENVAIVEYGSVTGIGRGTATITATTKNGKSATCTVTVSGDAAMIKNGTFDVAGDTSWALNGGAAIAAGMGRTDSAAAKLVKDASVSQTVARLEPATTYVFTYRYRATGGNVTATLTNGEAKLLEKTTTAQNAWTKMTCEITTPDVLAEGGTMLTFATTDDAVVYVDNVVFAKKASLIDFVVQDIYWVGGDDQVAVGTELVFAAVVTNQGTDPVPSGSVVEVDVAINTNVIQTLTYNTTATLSTGGSLIILGDTPWAAVKGDWVVSAHVNPRLTISEQDDSNNAAQAQLRVSDELLQVPTIAQQAGMDSLIFCDEFNDYDSIDTTASGDAGYKWYVTRGWSAGTVQRDVDYDVADGILTLHSDGKYGITLTTVDVNTHNGFSWNKGYLEVRLRIPNPVADEGGPTVWSLPLGKVFETQGDNTHWVEMDWLEFWGINKQHDNGYWTITLHDQEKDEASGDTTFWANNSNSGLNALGDEQWHTVGWLWDENVVQAYLDGEKVFEITYGEDDMPFPIPNVKTGEYHDGIFSLMNEHQMCLYLGGTVEHPLEVDYVHIWQGEGGGISAGDGDDGETAIDVDAEGFWYDYCTDDWGDPITAVNADNYQGILNGAELWERLSDERRAEINALLASLGQPSFDELLAAAQRLNGAGLPDTGEDARAFSAMTMALLVSGGVLWLTRKKRRG